MMDRTRMSDRQRNSTGSPRAPMSPTMSPMNRHAQAGSSAAFNMRRGPNNAAKAAAQRLAQVMAHAADEDDEDDDLALDYAVISGSGSIGLGGTGRATPARASLAVRPIQEQPTSARTRVPVSIRTAQNNNEQTPAAARPRSPMTVRTAPAAQEQQPPSAKAISGGRSSFSAVNSVEQPSPPAATSVRSAIPGHVADQGTTTHTVSGNRALELSPSARTIIVTRSPQLSAMNDLSPSARAAAATARPNPGPKAASVGPPMVPTTLRQTTSGIPPEATQETKRDKRLSLDLGSMNLRDGAISRHPSSSTALEDELDMLQEENESLLEKLRLAEERCDEVESRARQLEQQIASLGDNLGEGVSLEARLLSRQEAALQQREAALRVAAQTQGCTAPDVAALRAEAEIAREEATSALEQLKETESELKSLRLLTQRMILTPEEMEEVILKRCWLARYWGLCVRHGVYRDIAEARFKFWSSFAPDPVEVVLAAGQRAKMETDNDAETKDNPRDLNELSGEGNIENMLFVEQGLRELASLRVEEALAFTMAQHRRPNLLKSGFSDVARLPIEGHFDAYELGQDEAEDVSFKQAWLTYIWRRAKRHGIEPDIADERLQYWINFKANTSHDAVNVERGLAELKRFGIETQLWEKSRKELEQIIDGSKRLSRSDF
ncbi:coiled-coil domain-containing protein SCD2-like [Prosopis cineraria]|uniref:coiled-coil domain-containing protein SCD2-like n=1 Tax=Prosopis cineraria TaxID=364024 RepID=UPI00240F056F|nr:coiled-coil domain-containing protein SCD2-like [Prosopis cineraria]